MCDWQKEQDRLLNLWEEHEAIEPYIDEEDSEEEDEIDHLSTNTDYSDQEQAAGDEEVDDNESSKMKYSNLDYAEHLRQQHNQQQQRHQSSLYIPGCQNHLGPFTLSSTDFPIPKSPQGENKHRRTVFTSTQLLKLEQQYMEGAYLTKLMKINLASTLKLTERQVKIWFQNRRMKDKKISKIDHLSSNNSYQSTPQPTNAKRFEETYHQFLKNESGAYQNCSFVPNTANSDEKKLANVPICSLDNMTPVTAEMTENVYGLVNSTSHYNTSATSQMKPTIYDEHFSVYKEQIASSKFGQFTNIHSRHFSRSFFKSIDIPQPIMNLKNESTKSMNDTPDQQVAAGISGMKIEQDANVNDETYHEKVYNQHDTGRYSLSQSSPAPVSFVDIIENKIPQPVEELYELTPAKNTEQESFTTSSVSTIQPHQDEIVMRIPLPACPLDGLMSIAKFVRENPERVKRMISEGEEIEKKTIQELREFLKL
ncbi:unnamed protein product [Phaedon cochleariae]|uniref:Homeobox domain-containing protein n=1 Tax=Phaedon cochleariae TaxID=80249 RepID=A0A9N9SFE1_PHACE|nr:unnamed protein product [Phaedon cochleariae]